MRCMSWCCSNGLVHAGWANASAFDPPDQLLQRSIVIVVAAGCMPLRASCLLLTCTHLPAAIRAPPRCCPAASCPACSCTTCMRLGPCMGDENPACSCTTHCGWGRAWVMRTAERPRARLRAKQQAVPPRGKHSLHSHPCPDMHGPQACTSCMLLSLCTASWCALFPVHSVQQLISGVSHRPFYVPCADIMLLPTAHPHSLPPTPWQGTPDAPRCGFSRKVVDALQQCGAPFGSFDILSDEAVRQGLKVRRLQGCNVRAASGCRPWRCTTWERCASALALCDGLCIGAAVPRLLLHSTRHLVEPADFAGGHLRCLHLMAI